MTTKRTPKGDYEVGYCKTPGHTRFVKGVSGNPAGRKKGSRSLVTLIEEALDQKVTVKEGGRSRTMTMRKAIARQLVAKSAANDQRSLTLLLRHLEKDRGVPEQEIVRGHTVDDEAVIRGLRKRLFGEDGGDEAQS